MTDKDQFDAVIKKYYDVKKIIGTGAYGSVWECVEKSSRKRVAVKKIQEAFRNATDAQRTYREVTILRQLRRHPNIVRLYEVRRASNDMDIYLVFERMDIDLHHLITKKGSWLCDQHYQLITHQILLAVKYIHAAGIVHRDLKPSNILVSSKCQVKVGDLGLARTVGPRNAIWAAPSAHNVMTGYVATRWYRPPEILLSCKRYTKAVDLWSVGCILAEMILKKPLFQGENTSHQLTLILGALPSPSPADLEAMKELGASISVQQEKLTSGALAIKTGLKTLLEAGKATRAASHLVYSLVQYNPDRRLSASRALSHPYLSTVARVRNMSPVNQPLPRRQPLVLPIRDDVQLAVDDYRTVIYRDSDIRNSPKLPKSPARNNGAGDDASRHLPDLGVSQRRQLRSKVPLRLNNKSASVSSGLTITSTQPPPSAAPPRLKKRQTTTIAPNPRRYVSSFTTMVVVGSNTTFSAGIKESGQRYHSASSQQYKATIHSSSVQAADRFPKIGKVIKEPIRILAAPVNDNQIQKVNCWCYNSNPINPKRASVKSILKSSQDSGYHTSGSLS